MSGNPLVAGRQETTSGVSGLRLIEDVSQIAGALESQSWVDDALTGLSTVADAVALATDPLGEALSAGIGWALGHLQPLKKWLEELTGDAGAVAGGAQTWTNIQEHLGTCSQDLTTSLTVRLGDQFSATLTAYKTFQAGTAARLSVVAALAGAVSTGLGVASVVVSGGP